MGAYQETILVVDDSKFLNEHIKRIVEQDNYQVVIPVNMRQVAIGAAPDVSLRSGDIVYLPKTALGKMEEVTRQILPLLQGSSYVREVIE